MADNDSNREFPRPEKTPKVRAGAAAPECPAPAQEPPLNPARATLNVAGTPLGNSLFLAQLIHELRDPLNGILGLARLLERDAALPHKAHLHAMLIRHGGEQLLGLVNDLLDFEKIQAGHLEIVSEVWNTAPFFDELCYLADTQASRKGIPFVYEPAGSLPPKLNGDPRRLRQVLLNLLSNAIKFTEQGEIILRCGVTAGRLWIEVRDTGIGIAPEDLARIFEPFGQAGDGRYKSLGTGLGLALARRLTEAMGGTLDVASARGTGSTFRMETVAEVPPEPGQMEDSGRVTGYRRTQGEGAFRVLVVDDDPIGQMLFNGLLGPLGFAVISVQDGHSCLEMAPSLAPDLILMGYKVTAPDGPGSTPWLPALCGERPVPVIFISDAESPEALKGTNGAGRVARLAKPFHLGELLAAIATQLPIEWQCGAPAEGLPR